MFKRFLMTIGLLCAASASQALSIEFEFSGHTTFNPGAAGAGGFSGSIVYSTEGATYVNSGLFTGVFDQIDFNISGVNIQSAGAPTTNNLTQVELTDGRDAFISTYEGSFAATPASAPEIENVYFEIRLEDGVELFTANGKLFDSVSAGDTFDFDDFAYLSLVVEYVDTPYSQSTILRKSAFYDMEATVTGDLPAVPLPAGAPLLIGGIGAFGLLRRKSRKRGATL